jgi:hydrogenase-4 membrane subunit HyfE
MGRLAVIALHLTALVASIWLIRGIARLVARDLLGLGCMVLMLPVVPVALFLTDLACRFAFPEVFAGRGDSPTQISELVMSCLTAPLLVFLAARSFWKQPLRGQTGGSSFP